MCAGALSRGQLRTHPYRVGVPAVGSRHCVLLSPCSLPTMADTSADGTASTTHTATRHRACDRTSLVRHIESSSRSNLCEQTRADRRRMQH